MKTKIIVAIFMILVSIFAKAEPQKNYRRDFSECTFQKEKIEVEILSRNQYATGDDVAYGHLVTIFHNGKKVSIDLEDQGMSRYRMLRIYNDYCPKLLAMPIKKNEIAFFILKDNRPFTDSLMILYFDIKTHSTDIISTHINAKAAFTKEDKVYLKVANDNLDQNFGTVTIQNKKFNYIEKSFDPWISFDGKVFKFDKDLTYEKFEYKNLLKRKQLDELNDFKSAKYLLANDPVDKKHCLSLAIGDWTCE